MESDDPYSLHDLPEHDQQTFSSNPLEQIKSEMGDNFNTPNGFLASGSTDQAGLVGQEEVVTDDHGSLDFHFPFQAHLQPHSGNGGDYEVIRNGSFSQYAPQESSSEANLSSYPSTSFAVNNNPSPFSLPTSDLQQSAPRPYQRLTHHASTITPSDPSLRQPSAPRQPSTLPSSYPSFPATLLSSSSSVSKVPATRATPALPFPSPLLQQEETRTSLPPPMQAGPFTEYPPPSVDSGSPFSPSRSPEVSVGGGANGKTQFGGARGGIGSRGRESVLTQKGLGNGRDRVRGVNGLQRAKGSSRNGSEASGFGEEDEDDDAVVLVSRQNQPLAAMRNRRNTDEEVVEETPEPRIVRPPRKRARSPSGSEYSSPESQGEDDSESEFEAEKEMKSDQVRAEQMTVARRTRRKSSFGPATVNEHDTYDQDIEMKVGNNEEEDSRPREVVDGGDSVQSEIIFPEQNGTEIRE